MKNALLLIECVRLLGISITPYRQVLRYNAGGKEFTLYRYKIMAPISKDDPTMRVIQITDTVGGAIQSAIYHLIPKVKYESSRLARV